MNRKINPILRKTTARLKYVQNMFAESYVSTPKYCSIRSPFMRKDPEATLAKNFTNSDTVGSDLIGRHGISWLYAFAVDPDREHYFNNDLVLMSLNQANDMYNFKSELNQSRVFDFAYRYVGMGHVIVYFADLDSSSRVYARRDGGSNVYERLHNFNKICQWRGDHEKEGYREIPNPDLIFCVEADSIF